MALLGGGFVGDFLYFLGDDRINLALQASGFALSSGAAAAAAATGGDAKRQEEENEHNHCSDDYSDHHP